MWRFLIISMLLPSLAYGGNLVTPNAANPYPDLGADYYCTGASGERYELGETVCMFSNSCTDIWFAKCDMTNRTPMWRKTMDGCPGASLMDRFKGLDPILYSTPVHTKI